MIARWLDNVKTEIQAIKGRKWDRSQHMRSRVNTYLVIFLFQRLTCWPSSDLSSSWICLNLKQLVVFVPFWLFAFSLQKPVSFKLAKRLGSGLVISLRFTKFTIFGRKFSLTSFFFILSWIYYLEHWFLDWIQCLKFVSRNIKFETSSNW